VTSSPLGTTSRTRFPSRGSQIPNARGSSGNRDPPPPPVAVPPSRSLYPCADAAEGRGLPPASPEICLTADEEAPFRNGLMMPENNGGGRPLVYL
jgi:hypothetical protein